MRNSSRGLLYVVVVSVGFMAGLTWWLGLERASGAGAELDPSPAEAAARALERVAEFPEEVVLPATLAAAGVDDDDVIPDGAVVVPRTDTFEDNGDMAELLVDVRLPDGSIDTFVAVMVKVDEAWYLAYTVEGSDP